MIKSKIDYARKLNVVGAIQDKSADLTALGMGIVNQKNEANLIADNFMAAFGSSDPAVAETAFSYLGNLNTNNTQYKMVNGKLYYQIGNKANSIDLKNKSVYDIVRYTQNFNGVPNLLQTDVLDKVAAMGGKNIKYGQNWNMTGFNLVGAQTVAPVIIPPPGAPGAAPGPPTPP
jgi:hypothetical protein